MVLQESFPCNRAVTLCKYITTQTNAICGMNKCAPASVNTVTFVLVYTHHMMLCVRGVQILVKRNTMSSSLLNRCQKEKTTLAHRDDLVSGMVNSAVQNFQNSRSLCHVTTRQTTFPLMSQPLSITTIAAVTVRPFPSSFNL